MLINETIVKNNNFYMWGKKGYDKDMDIFYISIICDQNYNKLKPLYKTTDYNENVFKRKSTLVPIRIGYIIINYTKIGNKEEFRIFKIINIHPKFILCQMINTSSQRD